MLVCPKCQFQSKTSAGMASHMRHSHEGYKVKHKLAPIVLPGSVVVSFEKAS